MDLSHSFTVPASVADTWKTFEDIESVASCFPGAVVTQVDGDDFKGTCKVKLGPIAMVYSGSGTFVERDEAARRFVVDAKGKDKRGNGTAGAVVTATFTEESAGAQQSTRVDVQTDLAITGRPAQFGRGVIEDISNKLLQQFVTCLQDKVATSSPLQEDPDTAASAAAAGSGAAEASGPAGTPSVPVGGAGDPGDPLTTDAAASSALSGAPTPSLSEAARSALEEEPGTTSAGSASTGPSARAAASPATPVAGAPTAAPTAAQGGSDDALDLGATVLPVLARTYGPQAAGALLLVLVGYVLGRRRR